MADELDLTSYDDIESAPSAPEAVTGVEVVEDRVLDIKPDFFLVTVSMLPTFDPQSEGAIWNDNGTPVVSAGIPTSEG